ncbi:hypothetical protein C8A00DRAFT_46853 [Chaetomidium leptoderma]|uniref:Inosine/uridine-preferring nucleoside hydrolase domain-containing protein n=1 Tax=Chaetomidium leptoderma TaxID=669021 RepID=A0AAN6ZTD8_9PEZI|nr:hypothetical protein C8A00DRAFT_46853 [Chaetomidium leptoderma]
MPSGNTGNPVGRPNPNPSSTTINPRSTTDTHATTGGASSSAQKLPSRTNTMSTTGGQSGVNATGPSSQAPIPFNATTNKRWHGYYVKLAELVKDREPGTKPRIIVFTDIEQDYDDLLAVIFLAEMHRMGAIELAGFVANHHPAVERAKFLKTVLHLLGLPNVPVAIGTKGVEDLVNLNQHAPDLFYGLKNKTFRDAPWNRNPSDFGTGAQLIESLIDKNRPLTVLLISTLQDIGDFFDRHQKKNPGHLKNNFTKYVSQGGYVVGQKDGKVALTPCMDMTNNKFHPAQSANYTNCLARLGLPSDAWSREAAKAARLPGTFMQDLFKLGPIGSHLKWLWMRQEFKFYWDPFNWPFTSFLNDAWYLNTRLGLDKNSPTFKKLKENNPSFATAAPMIKVIAYDCCAAVGAVGDDFMRKMDIMKPESEMPAYNRASHNHRVFGKQVNDLGGVDADRLADSACATMKDSDKKAFQKVEHDHVTSPFELDVFVQKMMPLMRGMAEHKKQAAEHAKEAADAKTQESKTLKLKQAEAERKKAADCEARLRDINGVKDKDPIEKAMAKHREMAAQRLKESQHTKDPKEVQRLQRLANGEKEKAANCQSILTAIAQAKGRLPTRQDIPYEELYQQAMKRLGQSA